MILTVLGRRGAGKTTLVKERIREHGRVLIFDTLGEYGDVSQSSPDIVSFLTLLDERQHGAFRLSLCSLRDTDADLGLFLRAAWVCGDCLVVIDEIDAVASPVSVPWELARCIRYGRHRAVSLIGASRRAAEVPRILTSQSDEIVCFSQSEPRDIEYLSRYVGDDFAHSVSCLPRYRFLTWRPWDVPEKSAVEPEKPIDTHPET